MEEDLSGLAWAQLDVGYRAQIEEVRGFLAGVLPKAGVRGEAMTAVSEGGESVDMDTEEDASHTTEPKEERDDLINPFWIEDRDLGRGEVDYLSGPEIQFWKDLIEKYLYPIDADKTKQVSRVL